MRKIPFLVVIGLMAACTPHKKFRDRLVASGQIGVDSSDTIEVPEEVSVKAIPVEIKTNVYALPKLTPHGETWLPKTLLTRDLKAEWTGDRKKVLVRGSAQWNNPSTSDKGDFSFVLAGNWKAEAGIAELVSVSSETKTSGNDTKIRGKLYCIETNDNGQCSSFVVELFVRVHGVIYSGQFEQLAIDKGLTDSTDDLADSQEPGYNDELEGFDKDLEAVGSSEQDVDSLYQRQDIEKENDSIVEPLGPVSPSSNNTGLLPPPKDDADLIEPDSNIDDAINNGLPDVPATSNEIDDAIPESTRTPSPTQAPRPVSSIVPVPKVETKPSGLPTPDVNKKTSQTSIPTATATATAKPIATSVPIPSVVPGTSATKTNLPVVPTNDIHPNPVPSNPPVNKPKEEKTARQEDQKNETGAIQNPKSDASTPADPKPSAKIPQKPIAPLPIDDDKKTSEQTEKNSDGESGQASVKKEVAKSDSNKTQDTAQDDNKKNTEPGQGELPIDSRFADQSIGTHARGSLRRATSLKAVVEKMGERSRIRVVHPDQHRYFGNYAMIEYLVRSSTLLDRILPGMTLEVGDISDADGGRLRPHKSHQIGLDVDVGFFFEGLKRNYYARPATKSGGLDPRFDRQLSWKFFKSMMAYYHNKIYFVLLHPAVKRAMCEEAVRSGDIVKGKEIDPIVMHTLRRLVPESSHYNHFHVRLKCPSKDSRCLQTTRDLPMTMGCFKKK